MPIAAAKFDSPKATATSVNANTVALYRSGYVSIPDSARTRREGAKR
jgi:hypothetical protein